MVHGGPDTFVIFCHYLNEPGGVFLPFDDDSNDNNNKWHYDGYMIKRITATLCLSMEIADWHKN